MNPPDLPCLPLSAQRVWDVLRNRYKEGERNYITRDELLRTVPLPRLKDYGIREGALAGYVRLILDHLRDVSKEWDLPHTSRWGVRLRNKKAESRQARPEKESPARKPVEFDDRDHPIYEKLNSREKKHYRYYITRDPRVMSSNALCARYDRVYELFATHACNNSADLQRVATLAECSESLVLILLRVYKAAHIPKDKIPEYAPISSLRRLFSKEPLAPGLGLLMCDPKWRTKTLEERYRRLDADVFSDFSTASK